MCFFGDGASNEGAFHESINMAAVWKLPVIFLCENNQYGMSMSLARANSAADIADRAVGYGIPGETVDGMDLLAVYEAVSRAVEHARSGQGPVLINALTYRYFGHSKSDKQLYRTKQEVEAWKAQRPDPGLRQPSDCRRHPHRGRGGRAGSTGSQERRRLHCLGRRRPGAVAGTPDRRRVRRRAGGAGCTRPGVCRPGSRRLSARTRPSTPNRARASSATRKRCAKPWARRSRPTKRST